MKVRFADGSIKEVGIGPVYVELMGRALPNGQP